MNLKTTQQRNCLNITLKGCKTDNLVGCFGQPDGITLPKRNETSDHNNPQWRK